MAAHDPMPSPLAVPSAPRCRHGWVVLGGSAVIVRPGAGDRAPAFVMAGSIAMAVGVAALLIRRPKAPGPVTVAA